MINLPLSFIPKPETIVFIAALLGIEVPVGGCFDFIIKNYPSERERNDFMFKCFLFEAGAQFGEKQLLEKSAKDHQRKLEDFTNWNLLNYAPKSK